MLHEIAPHRLNNEFCRREPKAQDCLIVFDGNRTLLKKEGDNYVVPKVGEMPKCACHYLLSVDDVAYFLADDFKSVLNADGSAPAEFEFCVNRIFRGMKNPLERFGGVTSAHIAKWESLNKFCGRCGNPMVRGENERSMVCANCKNTVYPRISPVVIVAVHNGDELLMARNLDHPDKSRLFLISGFVEIGESLEQAAAREVFEEAGVRIKNVKYFGSEPWPFSESLISGFTAELDGDSTIHMQESELATACWIHRKDIPPYDTSVSISCAMIESFRNSRF